MKSETIQYIIVFVILALILGWVLHSLFSKRRNDKPGCPGCANSAACAGKVMNDASKRIKTKNDNFPC